MIGITDFGAYVPRLRLARKPVAMASGWLNPSLYAQSRGERAMANWDEDSITMGVVAARDCLAGRDRSQIGGIYFATTSAPFAERLNSSIVAEAVGLPRDITAVDLTSSTRCGLSAIVQAANQVRGKKKDVLVVASELTRAKLGSPQLLQQGDAAAALCVGSENVVAEILGHQSLSVDFVDSYRGAAQEFGHRWEERWIREEGYLKLVPETVGKLLQETGIEAGSIDAFICPSPIGGVSAKVAKVLGMGHAVIDHLEENCGNTGTAHPLLLLAKTLEAAEPGQRIIVASLGQGSEAMLLQTTANCTKPRPAAGVSGWLANGTTEPNFLKYLVYRGLAAWDEGGNGDDPEFTSLSALYRDRGFVNNLQGWHCAATRETFFGPEAEFKVARRTQDFVRKSFTESRARIISWSANHLGISRDPTICTGIIEFNEGGRLVMDIADIDADKLSVGLELDMAYRIHAVDKNRGFTRYFWKAVPTRPLKNDNRQDPETVS